jgi:cullin 4
MFKDMELSKDIGLAFAESQTKKKLQNKMSSEISVHVLTTGYWPAYPPAALNVPKDLLDHQEAFEKFYLSKHQGRRLSWHNSLAHCSMKARIGVHAASARPGASKELLVSLYQVCA